MKISRKTNSIIDFFVGIIYNISELIENFILSASMAQLVERRTRNA